MGRGDAGFSEEDQENTLQCDSGGVMWVAG
jgi:hypothetical protein